MDKFFRDCLIVSSFIHSLPFLIIILGLLHGCGGNVGHSSNKHSKQNNESIIPSNSKQEKEIVTIVIVEKKGDKAKHIRKQKSKPCRTGSWYGGVGLEVNESDGFVTRVIEGYPAWNAGIRTGWIIVNSIDLRGPPGTVVDAIILDKQRTYVLQLVRDKICTTKK